MEFRRFGKTFAFYIIPATLTVVVLNLMAPVVFAPTSSPFTRIFAFVIEIFFSYLFFRTARVIRSIR